MSKKAVQRNKYGQRIGAKGGGTRQRIMNSLATMLETSNLWNLQVRDVAAAADTAPTSFYTYFKGLEDVLLALFEQYAADQPKLARHIGIHWLNADDASVVYPFIEETIRYWEGRRGVLRLLYVLADLGDRKFIRARINVLHAMNAAFECVIKGAQERDGIDPDLDITYFAYKPVIIVHSVAGRYHQARSTGLSHKKIVHTTAHAIHTMLRGRAFDMPQGHNPARDSVRARMTSKGRQQ